MIEILQCKKINKGSMESKINIKIKEWNLVLNNILVFKKDTQRWISFPQEVYEKEGEKKYFPHVRFDDQNIQKRFQDSVLQELDKYCQVNKNEDLLF